MTGLSTRFVVRLTPRAGVDRIDGVSDGALRVRVAAAPVEDAANRALVRLVARELDVPASSVGIAGGSRSGRKTLVVEGIDPGLLRARWPGLRASDGSSSRPAASG